MDIEKIKDYWVEEALHDLTVSWHLFEKQDYSYALFFGHLALEKILKGLYVFRKKEQAPYIHNLVRLAESADIQLTDEQKESLQRISGFSLEARYPDEKRSFRKKCTEDFGRNELMKIEETIAWVKSMLP